MKPLDFRTVDLLVFIMANLVNVLLIGIFLSRARGMPRLEYYLGLILIILVLPLVWVVMFNLRHARPGWSVWLPIPLIIFLLIELVLDYFLKSDFRHGAGLWPYLFFFYTGLLGMMGYSFAVNKTWGFITLVTYFLNLWATWYAHR